MSLKILCVMPASGRQSMVDRAIRSFHSQSYPDKILAVLDNGAEPLNIKCGNGVFVTRLEPDGRMRSIGELRNLVNALATEGALGAQAIAHFDTDDISHNDRLTEQAELLQSSGADVVGFNEMLFWRTGIIPQDERAGCAPLPSASPTGEAWLFRSPNPKTIVGTSLLYTRAVWSKYPFPHNNEGEDTLWLHEKRIKRESVSSMRAKVMAQEEPRMIASIHGGNTTAKIIPSAREWRRAPEFDSYCREKMCP